MLLKRLSSCNLMLPLSLGRRTPISTYAMLLARPKLVYGFSKVQAKGFLPKIQSLGSFRKLMTQYDWSARLQLLGPTDGTLDRVYVKLQPCWEAEWQLQCEHDTISAVSCDLTRVLPTTLAFVWTGLLEKRPVQLEAPAKFWRMPISAPFRGARPFSDHASLN